MRSVCTVSIIYLLTASAVLALDDDSQWKKELRAISAASDTGDPRAMGIMGSWLRNGRVSVNMDEALALSKKSAYAGNPFGKYSLARIYELKKSSETIQLAKEAFEGLQHLALEGQDPFAMVYLAACYHSGTGVEKSYPEAVKWFKKAADQGNAEGQVCLGRAYLHGTGVEKSYPEAVKWFKKAADQGNAEGQAGLGCAYMSGEGVAKSYPEAVKWFTKAADQGNAQGQAGLGGAYLSGNGVEKSYPEAVKWFKKAADQENIKGQVGLGAVYMSPESEEFNPNLAVDYFVKAKRILESSDLPNDAKESFLELINKTKQYPPIAMAWANAMGKEQQDSVVQQSVCKSGSA